VNRKQRRHGGKAKSSMNDVEFKQFLHNELEHKRMVFRLKPGVNAVRRTLAAPRG